MKSNTKKVIAAIAAASILIGAQGAYASNYLMEGGVTDSIITPRYTELFEYYCELSVSSSGVLTCFAKTKVYSPSIAGVKVELQQNGSTITGWSSKGGTIANVDKTYSATKGNTYRLRTTYYAYDKSGNELEKIVGYSNEVSY